jgi:Kef-type K+ transport system membrane component KefB
MGLLVSFLYLLLHIAIILLIAYVILWVLRDWLGFTIDPMVYKFAQAIVALLILIAIVVWLAGALGYSGYRLPLLPP